jgi:hypothetical protein
VKNIYNEADLSKAVHENPTAVFNEIVELYKRNIAQFSRESGLRQISARPEEKEVKWHV